MHSGRPWPPWPGVKKNLSDAGLNGPISADWRPHATPQIIPTLGLALAVSANTSRLFLQTKCLSVSGSLAQPRRSTARLLSPGTPSCVGETKSPPAPLTKTRAQSPLLALKGLKTVAHPRAEFDFPANVSPYNLSLSFESTTLSFFHPVHSPHGTSRQVMF